MLLKLDSGVNGVDLSAFLPYISWAGDMAYFPSEVGINHHKLLAYLVKQLPAGSLVADLGTYLGASALALASNPDIVVLTFDITKNFDTTKKTCIDLPNVTFILNDCLNCIDMFITAKIIMLDVNPHNGKQERKLLLELMEREYKGIVICDDINLNEEMQAFWKSIGGWKKLDVTKYGHWSGTGIVVFDSETLDLEVI